MIAAAVEEVAVDTCLVVQYRCGGDESGASYDGNLMMVMLVKD